MELNELKPGMLVRHKGGKLYKIEGQYTNRDAVRMAYDHAAGCNAFSTTRVCATQWQVNDKYPEGRFYQATRELHIKDLTPAALQAG